MLIYSMSVSVDGFIADRERSSFSIPECRSPRLHDEFEGFPRSLLVKEDI
jgi:hypothetical protein